MERNGMGGNERSNLASREGNRTGGGGDRNLGSREGGSNFRNDSSGFGDARGAKFNGGVTALVVVALALVESILVAALEADAKQFLMNSDIKTLTKELM